MTPALRRELAHLFEVEARAKGDKTLAETANEIRRKIMSTEKDDKKQEIEVGNASMMRWGKKLLKVALVAAVGFFIGRKTA